MFTFKTFDSRSKVAAILFSVMVSSLTAAGFVTGAMVPISTAHAEAPAKILVPLA